LTNIFLIPGVNDAGYDPREFLTTARDQTSGAPASPFPDPRFACRLTVSRPSALERS
jgi:hypothetical protein